MSDQLAHRTKAELTPDRGRTVARLFLPGEELPRGRSRAGAVVARILALPEAEVQSMAEGLLAEFGARHREFPELLQANAAMVSAHIPADQVLSPARSLVLGASFTAEYAVEGAALCNPSAVLAPDQSGLQPGQARLAISLRAIGEGHLSSIGFCTAVVGPGPAWTFEERVVPPVAGTNTPAQWRREHLRAVLRDQGTIDELALSVLASLPKSFSGGELQDALNRAHPDLLARASARTTLDTLRQLVASAYGVAFPAGLALSQQVLLPSAAEESNGMEDARFVRFVAADGSVDYRATYTAYDGRHIAPRLLTSLDLQTFHAHRLAGPAARNKGMALFPRPVGDRYLALCRSDGESTSLASSRDGYVWTKPELVTAPTAAWEVLQVGNCGPPIETDEGWLVLTHGVGPLRTYSIGALLLDLEQPTRIVKRLERPLLQPAAGERGGYVPNVVYSCGAVVHDGLLWLPYGIGDVRIGVAWASVEELLSGMTPA